MTRDDRQHPPAPPDTSGGVRASYDAVAAQYAARLGDELGHKALDRGLLHAFLDLTSGGPIADLGCGPGHITRYLAARHPDVTGIDVSPHMIDIARAAAPDVTFTVATLLDLPAVDGAFDGLVALYSIIHLTDADRNAAFHEFARTLRPGGWLLLAFHTDAPGFPSGTANHLTTLFDTAVDLTFRFLTPDTVVDGLATAGFTIAATTIRQPVPTEYPSRRCYLLAQRHQ
ncbi:class I SAM-dependent methyltransferase [Micromonospora endolithica]|uniref:Class I SAM-dependent methyltransferase n=1 Tax=Micromonospora endolithica TaxID=230091 RepID=A0A3A9Z2G7_9ACTN|nr:class I SAM-dependent methyltransferase [Micromonospora endolithica]RKN41547.1 class I SAM-dependent methyltransferase [Micromonospora endolithica]